jgi:hypothetical protein
MARLARDLGYTLAELAERMTHEELFLWGLIYQHEYQEQEKEMKKARRR